MGFVKSPIRISSLDGSQWIDLDALVDAGATYTVAPARLLREIGIQPTRTTQVELADGTVREFGRGSALLSIDGRQDFMPVIFGDDDAEPIIGIVTLEVLELAVDPIGERLIPVRFIRM